MILKIDHYFFENFLKNNKCSQGHFHFFPDPPSFYPPAVPTLQLFLPSCCSYPPATLLLPSCSSKSPASSPECYDCIPPSIHVILFSPCRKHVKYNYTIYYVVHIENMENKTQIFVSQRSVQEQLFPAVSDKILCKECKKPSSFLLSLNLSFFLVIVSYKPNHILPS